MASYGLLGRVNRHWISADWHAVRPCPHDKQGEKYNYDDQQPEVTLSHTAHYAPDGGVYPSASATMRSNSSGNTNLSNISRRAPAGSLA
jgi:hypothetical protein